MPAEIAKAILRDGSGVVPAPGRDARHLSMLATRLSRDASLSWDLWYAAIEDADTRTLIAAMAALGTTGTTGARYEAFRDAARAMVEQKLTDQTIAEMRKLEKASTRLGWVAAALTAVGVVATLMVAL